MMSGISETSLILLCMLVAVLFWEVRTRTAQRAAQRILELKRSAEHLKQHRLALEHVLGDPEATDELKLRLIGMSDVFANRDTLETLITVVLQKSAFAALRNLRESDETPDPVSEQLKARPELGDAYRNAFMLGFVGGMLRWRESAKYYDRVMDKLLGDSMRGASVDKELTKFWNSSLSGLASKHYAEA